MPPQLQHTLAAVLVEVAYLGAGLVLCYFGKEMLEKGLTTGFRADGSVAGTRWRIATSSPGLVFMLAGLVIIGLAIRTQAQFEQDPGAAPSLDALASGVVVSRFAQASPEQVFAREQMAAALRAAQNAERGPALLSLVNAIVVSPALLKPVLDHPDLRALTTDPAFAALVRARFALPLTHDSAAPAGTSHPVVGALGLFAGTRSENEDVSALLGGLPRQAAREPVEATAERLRAALARNPRAVYQLLRSPEYVWVLRDERLVNELLLGMARLEADQ
jgi:hypothetical protein